MSGRHRLAGWTAAAAAALAALAVAQLAIELLSPATIDPLRAGAGDVLGPERLAVAEAYREGGRQRALIALALELAALLALALRPPRRLRTRSERLRRRPFRAGALAGAAISLALALLTLPLAVAGHERAVDVGLATQSLGSRLGDFALSAAIAAVFAAVGGGLLLYLQRRLPRGWWAAGAGVVVAFAIVTTWLGPQLLTPLFNDLERLPDGRERRAVVTLAERVGVDVDEVYEIDASRRSRSINAFVDGLGGSRVVIHDNARRRLGDRALRSLLAHELAHAAERDVPRGLLFVAIVAPFGLAFVLLAGGRIATRAGAEPGTAAALPAYALALVLAASVLGAQSNQLSRAVEAKADEIAVGATGDPRALTILQREIAATNLSDPDPPGWYQAIFATHPSPAERVGMARALAAGE